MSSEPGSTNSERQQQSAHLDPSTTVLVAGNAGRQRPLAPDLVSATTFRSTDFDEARRDASRVRPDEFYARYSNPTVRDFERAIAELEHAEDAIAFGSGMGGIATTILALCSQGSHIVAARQLYSGTIAFLEGPCRRFGIDTTFVDGTVPGALAAAVEPGRTMLVIGESPSNPLAQLIDLNELGSIVGPFTVVDSTFATPLAQSPLDHGVDLVFHSATKGIAGHNDATLGVVAGERDLIEALWAYSVMHGATASPYDCMNALRGIKTLAVRQERQAQSALTLARWLLEHPAVAAVHYAGLECHPQHLLAAQQMSNFGSMLAFEVAGGQPAAEKLLNGLSLIRLATSVGGPETLMCHPATTTAAALPEADRTKLGVTPGLVRVSVGLEHCDDLIAEIDARL